MKEIKRCRQGNEEMFADENWKEMESWWGREILEGSSRWQEIMWRDREEAGVKRVEGGGEGDKGKVWECTNETGILQPLPETKGRLRDFSGNRRNMNWWFLAWQVQDSGQRFACCQEAEKPRGGSLVKSKKLGILQEKKPQTNSLSSDITHLLSPGAICLGIDPNDNKFPSDF